MKRFLSKFLSSESSKAESNAANHSKPKARKSVFGLFGKTSPAVHAFGILGVVGPLNTRNAGWMVTDYATWILLVSHMKGYAPDRSVWRTIRPIHHLFSDGLITVGEAACDRLQLPLPPTLPVDPDHAEISAEKFKSVCIISLMKMALQVEPAEKLILLLIAHSDSGVGEFRILLTTQTDSRIGEASITKDELEWAVEPCRGEIFVICNSCYSGSLASERWSLLSSATSEEMADALSQSRSGYVSGSVFTAKEHGLQVPLPRAEPRVTGDEWVSLPPSRPSHSFATPAVTHLSLVKPSNMSFKEFGQRMQNIERFLRESLGMCFQVSGPQSSVGRQWTSILPLNLTAEAVCRIRVKADRAGFANELNGTTSVASLAPQGGPSPTLGSQDSRFDPLLVILANAMPEMNNASQMHTPEAAYAKNCADFRLHIAQPEQFVSPFEAHVIDQESLLLALISMHTQAIAVQKVAQLLNWCSATDGVVPYFLEKIANWNIWDMIERGGVRVDKLPKILQKQFPRLRLGMDRNSVLWLSVQWAAAGRPVIEPAEWDKLMENIGDLTKREALC